MALHFSNRPHRFGNDCRVDATPSLEPREPPSYTRSSYDTSASMDASAASIDITTIPFSTGVVGTALSEADMTTCPLREAITSSSGAGEAALAYLRASVASALQAGADNPCPEVSITSGRLGWRTAVALILATVLGGGVVFLPGAVAELGWRIGFLTLLLFYCMSFFTAYLLHKLHMVYRYPAASSIGDICANLFGFHGGCAAWGVLYLFLLSMLARFLVYIERVVHDMVFKCDASNQGPLQNYWNRILVAAALLVPASQARSLWRLAPLAVLSVLSALVVLTLYLVAILQDTHGSDYKFLQANSGMHEKQTQVTETLGVWTAVSQIAFFFTGQMMFLEIQAEMKEPARFWKSVKTAYLILLAISVGIATVSLWKCGEDTPSTVLDVIRAADSKGAFLMSSVLLVVHFVACYSIPQQVLAHEITVWIMPSAMAKGAMARLQWLGITVAQFLAAALLLCIPNDTGVLDCLADFASTLSFGFPCVLYLASRRQQQLLTDLRSDQAAAVACAAIILIVVTLAVADAMTWAHSTPSDGIPIFAVMPDRMLVT